MTNGRAGTASGALLLVLLLTSMNLYAQAQSQVANAARVDADSNSDGSSAVENTSPSSGSTQIGLPLIKNILSDQKSIWTSPVHLRWTDINWLVPVGGATAVFIATDPAVMKTISPASMNRWVSFSNYGIGAMAAVDGGTYLLGELTDNDHEKETGILAGEAAVDSLAVTTVTKYAFRRERPYQDPKLRFFHGGDSFPSDHSTVAWSVASVFAHEYPGPLTQVTAYGLATAISAARVLGRQHSPSDVFVGAAIGWLVGQHVYRAHHDVDLGGSAWESPSEYAAEADERTAGKGSPYVPLDSWIYPALDRLRGLGYIHTAFVDSRPWTRIECAQFVEEAGSRLADGTSNLQEATHLYDALSAEFAEDLSMLSGETTEAARLESAYTRVTQISGPPLHDSYHFGQTIYDDFGRPYAQGTNAIAGLSGWSTYGRYSVYVRGEYQYAPSSLPYPQAALDLISQRDVNPDQPPSPFPAVNHLTLLDTYALVNVDNWEFSFGKQSLWWGAAQGGALAISDNAPPILMFRARQVSGSELPGFLHVLGPAKWDLFFGQLAGNLYPARPLMHGIKLSVERTPNMQFGISVLDEFGGVGRPVTGAAVFNSYFSLKSSDLYPANANPGKRVFDFDWTYRPPVIRDWVTLYADGLLPEDNPTPYDMSQSPIYAPSRTALRPGLYLSHVPGIPKLDFRVEAVYTNPPTLRSMFGQYIYYNNFYHDLFTNDNFLIGDWIGREGMGFQAWTTYWFSPRTTLQFAYRHAKVASDFVTYGETVNDGSSTLNWQVRDGLTITASLQYEKWVAPILAPTPQTNVTSSIGVTYWPRWGNR